MTNRRGNNGNSERLFWGVPKITADGECSREIKIRLFLGRKAMTNLDSILKNRAITLPTKVCLVKAMFLPVVMYGCESWTIKNTERWRIHAFELWCWRKLLRVPWTAGKSKQSVLKEISPEYWLMLKLQYFGHMMQKPTHRKTLMLGKIECGRRREQRGEMVGWHLWMDGQEFEQAPRSWWWTGKPGVLQSMGSQRVGHNWATKVNWAEKGAHCPCPVGGRHVCPSVGEAVTAAAPACRVVVLSRWLWVHWEVTQHQLPLPSRETPRMALNPDY